MTERQRPVQKRAIVAKQALGKLKALKKKKAPQDVAPKQDSGSVSMFKRWEEDPEDWDIS